MSFLLDLNVLSPQEFQTLCWRLVQREHAEALLLNIGSWDGGRDIVSIGTPEHDDLVFQCKSMRETRFADLKRAVRESLDALNPTTLIDCWTLCLSKDPTQREHPADRFRPHSTEDQTKMREARQFRVEQNPRAADSIYS
jgi:hypothetical protein